MHFSVRATARRRSPSFSDGVTYDPLESTAAGVQENLLYASDIWSAAALLTHYLCFEFKLFLYSNRLALVIKPK